MESIVDTRVDARVDARLKRCFAIFFVAVSMLVLPLAAEAQESAEAMETLPAQGALLAELQKQLEAPPPEGDDPLERCIYHHKRGMANVRLGRTDEAIIDLKQALSLNQPLRSPPPGSWCQRFRIQIDLANAYRQAGDPRARVAFVKEMGEELRKTNTRRYFFTLTWLMDDYVTLGMLKNAEEALNQASSLIPELRQRRDWATEEANVLNQWNVYLAYMQDLRGNFAEAERLRRESLKQAQAYLALRTRIDGTDSQLIPAARRNVASALRLLGNTLSAQGKFSEAEFYNRESLTLFLSFTAKNSPDVARVLANLGVIKMQQGRLALAEDYLRQALSALEGGQVRTYSPQLAAARGELAFVLQMQDRWAESLALFEVRDQGLRSNPAQIARTGLLRTDWAMALIRNGKVEPAVDMMQRIVAHYQRVPYADPQLVARAKGYLAVALAAQGDSARALAAFEEAIPLLMQQVASDSEGDGLGAGRQFRTTNILEAYLGLLSRLHLSGEQMNGRNPVAVAFSIADIARGSAVQRAVAASSARANLPDAALSELARKEQDAGNRKASLTKILARLASAPEAQRLDSVVTDMRREIDQLTAQQGAYRKELASRYPDYVNLVDPKPATMAEIQAALKPDEAVVALYSAHDRTYVWTLTPQRAGFQVVAVERQQLAADVARVRSSLDLSDGTVKKFDAERAQALYQLLLSPDEALWASSKLLNVIPHGALGQIPFGLLLTAAHQSSAGNAAAPWLIRRIAVAQQSSASSFLALRQRNPSAATRENFIGFGDPVFMGGKHAAASGKIRNLRLVSPVTASTPEGGTGNVAGDAFARLSPLPDTQLELEEMARAIKADPRKDLFLGARATEGNVKRSRLAGYRVVAFATHGLVPGELVGLDQPALALANPLYSNDKENDGLLTLEEVLGLRLDAEWVVLSACNTGSSDGLQGEAVSGLGRGFFFAGARSLLVSNWAVETVSARLLTTGVFKLQMEDAGLTRAEALRRSMLKLMSQGEIDYAHPAFWAPFTLVGDGYR